MTHFWMPEQQGCPQQSCSKMYLFSPYTFHFFFLYAHSKEINMHKIIQNRTHFKCRDTFLFFNLSRLKRTHHENGFLYFQVFIPHECTLLMPKFLISKCAMAVIFQYFALFKELFLMWTGTIGVLNDSYNSIWIADRWVAAAAAFLR